MGKSPRLGLGIIVAGVLALTACRSTPPAAAPSTTPSGVPTSSPAVRSVAGINQTPRDQLTRGGELRLGVVDWTEDWNPWTLAPTPQLDIVLAALRPEFFDVSPAGVLTADPDWLSGQPEVSHAPVTSVTYRLNPLARWGDGQPMTADDFAATWQACAAPDGPCRDRAAFAHVTDVAAGPTAHDVVVTYDRVEADWATTFRYGPARAGSLTQPWTDPAATPGWFAGPFRVRSLDRAGRHLTLEPNPWWPGDKPVLSSVTITAYPADDLAPASAAGVIDAWPVDLDPGRYTAAATDNLLQLRRTPSDRWRVLLLGQTGPLKDRLLRQALLQGLDRARVGQADLPGIDWTPATLDHLAWQPGQADYADLAETTSLGFDPAAAATTLDQAGWTLTAGQRRNLAGAPLHLTFLVDPRDPLSESEGLQVAAQLATLGVTVDVARPDSPQTYAAALSSGGFDLTSQTWRNDLRPAADLAGRLASDGPANVSGYADRAVDQLLAQAATAVDPERHVTLLADAAAILWTDVAAIPLYVVPETWATLPKLANFGPTGLASQRWQDVGFA